MAHDSSYRFQSRVAAMHQQQLSDPNQITQQTMPKGMGIIQGDQMMMQTKVQKQVSGMSYGGQGGQYYKKDGGSLTNVP